MFTKMIVFSISVFGLGLVLNHGIQELIPSVQAHKIEDKTAEQFVCTPSNLSGNYGISADGVVLESSLPFIPVGPVASIGRLTVKGNSIFVTLQDNLNGNVTPFLEYTGSFTVNRDCTGTFATVSQLNSSLTAQYTFVVVNRGKEIQFLRTGGSSGVKTVIGGVAKKQ